MHNHCLPTTLLIISIVLPSAQAEFRPFLITLDQNDDFVITGDGHYSQGIEFRALDRETEVFERAPGKQASFDDTSASAPAPYEFKLMSRQSWVTYGRYSRESIKGSFSLRFGPLDVAYLDDFAIHVGYGSEPRLNPMNLICADCSYPNVMFNSAGGIEIGNINEPMIDFTLLSQDGGISLTEIPFDASIVEFSPTSVTLENANGFSATDLRQLDFEGLSDERAVFAKFTLHDRTKYGPFLVSVAAVPEPSAMDMFVIACMGMLTVSRKRRAIPMQHADNFAATTNSRQRRS